MSEAYEALKKEAAATKDHLFKLEKALAVFGKEAVSKGTKSAVKTVKKWSAAANAKRSEAVKAYWAKRKAKAGKK